MPPHVLCHAYHGLVTLIISCDYLTPSVIVTRSAAASAPRPPAPLCRLPLAHCGRHRLPLPLSRLSSRHCYGWSVRLCKVTHLVDVLYYFVSFGCTVFGICSNIYVTTQSYSPLPSTIIALLWITRRAGAFGILWKTRDLDTNVRYTLAGLQQEVRYRPLH